MDNINLYTETQVKELLALQRHNCQIERDKRSHHDERGWFVHCEDILKAEEPVLPKPDVNKANFFEGRQELYREHHREESEKLMHIMHAKGFTSCGIRDAEGLWMEYSDAFAAGFLGMDGTDEEIYECIKDQLVVRRQYNIG